MKVYSNKYQNSEFLMPGYEFEVLNELKDTSKRTDDNCLYHTRFLFEMDSIGLDEQKDYIKKNIDNIQRVVFSGSKSYHIIIEFPNEYESFCKDNYRTIWSHINNSWFDGKCDTQCKNPSRLTRTPNVVRSNKNTLQQLMYYKANKTVSDPEAIKRDVSRIVRMNSAFNLIRQPEVHHKSYNNSGKTLVYEPVKYYLSTPFPKMNGNGNSSISLFKALRCAIKYGDSEAIDQIERKAMSEHWSRKEIDRIKSNIEDKYI